MTPSTSTSRRLLYAAAFTAGMTTLAVEMSISRLIGAVLGTSNLVWAAVIALVLVYLTAGSLLGGRLADRIPTFRMLFLLLVFAATAAGMVPVLARPLTLAMASAFFLADLDIVVLGAAGLTVAILFALPVTLLGCVSPFVTRLAVTDAQTAGQAAGRVYAISTLGSILGTFGPVLVLIPSIGTDWTFAVFAGALMVIGLAGLFRVDRRTLGQISWAPVLMIAVFALAARGPVRPAPAGTDLLYEAETPYNYVQVAQVTGEGVSRQPAGTRLLLLNEGQGVHSTYHPDVLGTGATWDFFLAGPYFNPAPYAPASVDRVAIIGLAAGTIARQHSAVYGPVAIDGVEIDPGIVEAGRRYFGMTMPNLNVIIEDGRYALGQLGNDYDLIAIDAYRVPYIPWQLTTREFFEEVRAHLAPGGVVMVNVGRASQDRRFVDAMAATMGQVFASLHAMDVPFSFNTMLAATPEETSAENLLANLAALPPDAHPFLRQTLTLAADSLVPVTPSALVFTDDRAPVETMINAMIFDFIFGEGNLAQFE